LDNLKLPEYRTRYRTRRELRERNPEKVLAAMKDWVAGLDKEDPNYEHHVLEALWVSWGLNQIDEELLVQMLEADDFRARTAAARILRYTGHQVDNQVELLRQAAADPHNRVRLEALVAASWLSPEAGNEILEVAGTLPLDRWMAPPYETALAHLNDRPVRKKDPKAVWTDLQGKEREMYFQGMEIYSRDGHCATCHQPKGQGLHASGFPPLINTDWVLGDEERLIKLTLHGLMGPMDVLGKHYPGNVPMTPWGGMLNDEEIAAVLTYVRNSFGNGAPAIYPDKVKKVREATKDQEGYYSPAELMEGK
ncbi:MAG: c-type cytochrome, partial [Bacteroidota bacterium]